MTYVHGYAQEPPRGESARAESEASTAGDGSAGDGSAGDDSDEYIDDGSTKSDTIVIGYRRNDSRLRGRAHSQVSARQVRERLARSTPEALGEEVGAYVQQTAHGQGSVYLRGRTGRHTLLLVDGFRLNHALFRQGPNQYLFTIDPLSLNRVEILRGGGAVSLGANALSGAILVTSKRPRIDPTLAEMRAQTTLSALYASADLSRGARAEFNLQLTKGWGLYAATGWIEREELEAAGPLPTQEGIPEVLILEKRVPRFQSNDRVQMGTGYQALSGDLVSRLKFNHGEWIIATRLYRQYDAPRTDQCPPPEAPESWCLRYTEQFRTHTYSTLELKTDWSLARAIWIGASFQRQHERRENDRESYLNLGRDAVNVWEARARSAGSLWRGESAHLELRYGADSTYEEVTSKAWDTLVRSAVTRERSRGQYLDGSAYLRGGGWGQLTWSWGSLEARGGARYSFTRAQAPGDEQSESASIDRSWRGLTLGGGLSWQFTQGWALLANLEEGFAPPNLDDLTARQLTGQGYQIENPLLGSERSLTYEAGIKQETAWRWPGGSRGAVSWETWGFLMRLDEGIERRDATCPVSERSCVAARVATPFTLVNLADSAWIYGVEHQLTLTLPASLTLREHFAYAKGEGSSPLASELGQSRPLSRIPPLNGGVSLGWESPERILYARLGARWAFAQDQLSFGDEIDHRIPYGGTPGYVVFHARVGLRAEAWEVNLALENLGDEIYRVHGSSVNGAGRGASLLITHQL